MISYFFLLFVNNFKTGVTATIEQNKAFMFGNAEQAENA